MTSQGEPPLDEVQWRNPAYVQELGGIHTNTVLPYFYASSFFDPTSNNGVITNMAMRRPDMFHIIQTRQAFEDYLSGMMGVEYRVVQDPSDNDRIPFHVHSGVWVIRKQRRFVVEEQEGNSMVERVNVEPLSTYHVVGENIYMSSTVGAVLGSRLISIGSALTNLFQAASPLPIYNPALGRVYNLPTAKPTALGASALDARQNSKEPTPLPEAQTASSLANTPGHLESPPADPTDQRHAALLAETLSNNLRYGREYMDEHPLIGEPGSFIIQKSKDLQVPLEKDNAAKEKRAVPVPPPLKTDIPTEAGKKGKGQSGTDGPKSPLSPTGTVKKRKKSKVQTPRTPKTPR